MLLREFESEADRVADVVFEGETLEDKIHRLYLFWSFSADHSALFDSIDGPETCRCLTLLRSDRFHNQTLFEFQDEFQKEISADPRIKETIADMITETMTRDEFRESLKPFIEYQAKAKSRCL